MVAVVAATAVGVVVDAGVSGQLIGAGEAFAAARELACVRFLACVRPDVSGLVFEAVEGFRAHGALVRAGEVVVRVVVLLRSGMEQ